MRRLDPRVHLLCKIYAMKKDLRVKPQVTAVNGLAATQIDGELWEPSEAVGSLTFVQALRISFEAGGRGLGD